MTPKETWPPAVIARAVEKRILGQKSECAFDTTKEKHLILIPGMGAVVSQLFDLVRALRGSETFREYGVTAVELGLSLGKFRLTLQRAIKKIEESLLSQTSVSEIVLFGHSHGGRFASELAVYLQEKHPHIKVMIITGGTPITERPQSWRNWFMSLSFRCWPVISQPGRELFYALYSDADTVVGAHQATSGSQAQPIELDNFTHDDFIHPEKIVPELEKLVVK